MSDSEELITEKFTQLRKEKEHITGVYVLKITSGGVQLVCEGSDSDVFGPIGGRVARMDDNGGLNFRDTLAREYVSETRSILPMNANLIPVTVHYDTTQRFLYENHFYLWRSDDHVASKKVKTYPIAALLTKDSKVPLRPWFKRAIVDDMAIRTALSGQQSLTGFKEIGSKMIGTLHYLYVLPELNPGMNSTYRIGIQTVPTETGAELIYTPKRVSWSVVKSDAKKTEVGIKSAVLVPTDLDSLRIRKFEDNIMDLVSKLPRYQGDDCVKYEVFPLSDYLPVGA